MNPNDQPPRDPGVTDAVKRGVAKALHGAASGLREVGDELARMGKESAAEKLARAAAKLERKATPDLEVPRAHPGANASAFDSAEAGPLPLPPPKGKGRAPFIKVEMGLRHASGKAGKRKKHRLSRHSDRLLTVGDVVLFILGLFLTPLWVIASIVLAIGPGVVLVGCLFTALATSIANLSAARTHDPERRRALDWASRRDWGRAGEAFAAVVYQAARPWGLAKLVRGMGYRINEVASRYHTYIERQSDLEGTPEDFRADYHVVDQLPSGGSSARIYVVRRAGGNPDDLYVLKYFDLGSGARLESLIRENQAVELARRLNLIVDSRLGAHSFYYVMPYHRGDTLTKRVLDEFAALGAGVAPPSEFQALALGWAHQLLQLIAQYHEAGVFHKDIKPDNMIVDGEYTYLVDIGLMTPLESVRQLTTHGTEYFRDPEMVKLAMAGKLVREVDAAKFDLYSIGAVLYFALEGEFPSTGSLSRFHRPISRAVQMVVGRAMAPFERRYAGARQMLADVDYLCWAAAQGKLDEVRPADLPGLRGDADLERADDTDRAAVYPPLYAVAKGEATRKEEARRGPLSRFVSGLLVLGGIIALSGIGIAAYFHIMNHSVDAFLASPGFTFMVLASAGIGLLLTWHTFKRGRIVRGMLATALLAVIVGVILDVPQYISRNIAFGVWHSYETEGIADYLDGYVRRDTLIAHTKDDKRLESAETPEQLATAFVLFRDARLTADDSIIGPIARTTPVIVLPIAGSGDRARQLADELRRAFDAAGVSGGREITIPGYNAAWIAAQREFSERDMALMLLLRYRDYLHTMKKAKRQADAEPIPFVFVTDDSGAARLIYPCLPGRWTLNDSGNNARADQASLPMDAAATADSAPVGE